VPAPWAELMTLSEENFQSPNGHGAGRDQTTPIWSANVEDDLEFQGTNACRLNEAKERIFIFGGCHTDGNELCEVAVGIATHHRMSGSQANIAVCQSWSKSLAWRRSNVSKPSVNKAYA
jgi:hypothetical protein